MTQPKIVILGANIAGLTAALFLAEKGVPVILLSSGPARFSEDAGLPFGLNVGSEKNRWGDTSEKHFSDTVAASEYLCHQELVWQMTRESENLWETLIRLGVLFDETETGEPRFYSLEGSPSPRTVFGGFETGRRILLALESQLKKFLPPGLIQICEGYEPLSLVKDDNGACRGLVAMDSKTSELRTFSCDKLLLCAEGLASFWASAVPSLANGAAGLGVIYQAGACLANPEFVHIHPACLAGHDRFYALGSPLLARGARLFIKRAGKPWYFLEDYYPVLKNNVPFVVANRAITKVAFKENRLYSDLYLDATHLALKRDDTGLRLKKLTFRHAKADLSKAPIPVMPAVCASLGGFLTDSSFRTNIPGVYAAGEAQAGFHGANCLEGNLLLAKLFSGLKAATVLARPDDDKRRSFKDAELDSEIFRQQEINKTLLQTTGSENVFGLFEELRATLEQSLGLMRDNRILQEACDKIAGIGQRSALIALHDRGPWVNQELVFTRRLSALVPLAQAMVEAALKRDESRGAHYKPQFPTRDDHNFLKISKVAFGPHGPQVGYEDVEMKYVRPEGKLLSSLREAAATKQSPE